MLKPYVEISGLQINGETSGQEINMQQSSAKPALILLHGWGVHGGIWQTILPELNQDFTVYNIDLPGFGRSPIANTEYDLNYLIESVKSVVPESFYLMGWSLGGLVAKAFSLRYPEQVKKLITVASSPCFVKVDDWPFAMPIDVLESFIGYLEEDYEGTLIRFLAIQTMGSETQKEDIKQLKETVFLHGQPAPKALSGGLKILHQTNLLAELEKLKMPMLRIYGRLDSLVPVKVCATLDKLIPESKSIIYKSAAHAPFLSLSSQFCEDIKSFINK